MQASPEPSWRVTRMPLKKNAMPLGRWRRATLPAGAGRRLNPGPGPVFCAGGN
jgi:hypothetical protein